MSNSRHDGGLLSPTLNLIWPERLLISESSYKLILWGWFAEPKFQYDNRIYHRSVGLPRPHYKPVKGQAYTKGQANHTLFTKFSTNEKIFVLIVCGWNHSYRRQCSWDGKIEGTFGDGIWYQCFLAWRFSVKKIYNSQTKYILNL